MTGKEPIPNPFTREHMKVGDQVTIDSGFLTAWELEARFFLKKIPGVAVDVKFDESSTKGNRLVITLLADPSTGEPTRVTIASGTSITDIDKLAAGLIYNPKKDKDKGAEFLRGLVQYVNTGLNNHFELVELDISNVKGKALYDQILKTGQIPAQKEGIGSDIIKAHAGVDFKVNKNAWNLNWAAYKESDETKRQLSVTETLELSSRVQVERIYTSYFADPTSVQRLGSNAHQNPNGDFEGIPNFSFSQGEIRANQFGLNGTLASVEKLTDFENRSLSIYKNLMLTSTSVASLAVQSLFESELANSVKNANKNFVWPDPLKTMMKTLTFEEMNANAKAIAKLEEPVTYHSLTLRQRTGEDLHGQAALTHLNNVIDPPDLSLYESLKYKLFSAPDIDLVWKLQEGADPKAFTDRLAHDAKAYYDKETTVNNSDETWLQTYHRGQMVVAAAISTGGNNLLLLPHQADNPNTLRELAEKEDILKKLEEIASTDPCSFLYMLAKFREAGGDKAPYPIDVTFRMR
jgi:hypothetical protein